MKIRFALIAVAIAALVGGSVLAGEPLKTAREGSQMGGPAPMPNGYLADILDEGFEDILVLGGEGWFFLNHSVPPGPYTWFQGNSSVFPAHEGAPDAYVASNWAAGPTAGVGDCNNWMLLPELELSDIGSISFWTTTVPDSGWPDALQLRLSLAGGSIDVGNGAFAVGDFTELLVDINPGLDLGGYPEEWTQFCVDNPGWGGSGRFAFRYFVTECGGFGVNSNYIGVDTLEIDTAACGAGDGGDGGDGGGDGGVPASGPAGLLLLVVVLLGASLFYMRR